MYFNYVTVLSNWILGYDKYSTTYSKEQLSQSTYKNEFYLLKDDELHIGLSKAQALIQKISLHDHSQSNAIIRIETELHPDVVHKNTRNNLGWVIPQNWITVSNVYLYINGDWVKKTIEDITALAYTIHNEHLIDYQQLKPRTLSLLPVAKACQAACKFCFSESSISFDQKRSLIDLDNLDFICQAAKKNGAERFVITGGGEPTLIAFNNLLDIISVARKHFTKIVLISNGMFLSEKEESVIIEKLQAMIHAGLTVLSLSYHHYDPVKNAHIMGKDIKTDFLLNVINQSNIHEYLTIRLICVLQKEGIDSKEEIEKYLNYSISKKIHQVCFKELYISSTTESLYASQKENQYSQDNQISLSVLTNYLHSHSIKIAQLPWGSPVYRYHDIIDVAAYTEPSVGWERTNGIARSWNIMADGKCFASLEDKNSLLEIK